MRPLAFRLVRSQRAYTRRADLAGLEPAQTAGNNRALFQLSYRSLVVLVRGQGFEPRTDSL